jgi:hypothetical protein
MGTPVTEQDMAAFASMRESRAAQASVPPPQAAQVRMPEGYQLPNISLPPEVAASFAASASGLTMGHGTPLQPSPVINNYVVEKELPRSLPSPPIQNIDT